MSASTYAELCRRAAELAELADRTGDLRYLAAAVKLHREHPARCANCGKRDSEEKGVSVCDGCGLCFKCAPNCPVAIAPQELKATLNFVR